MVALYAIKIPPAPLQSRPAQPVKSAFYAILLWVPWDIGIYPLLPLSPQKGSRKTSFLCYKAHSFGNGFKYLFSKILLFLLAQTRKREKLQEFHSVRPYSVILHLLCRYQSVCAYAYFQWSFCSPFTSWRWFRP